MTDTIKVLRPGMTKDDGGPAFPFPSRILQDPYDPGMQEKLRNANLGMSLRAYAAISLRVPDSGIEWLDAMIQEARIAGH